MKATPYKEMLKSPQWQKRRLEILERDQWKCVVCGDGHKTLHVHHTEYMKGNAPWEYPQSMLITLCDPCHKKEHELRETGVAALASAFYMMGATSNAMFHWARLMDELSDTDVEPLTDEDWFFLAKMAVEFMRGRKSGGMGPLLKAVGEAMVAHTDTLFPKPGPEDAKQ